MSHSARLSALLKLGKTSRLRIRDSWVSLGLKFAREEYRVGEEDENEGSLHGGSFHTGSWDSDWVRRVRSHKNVVITWFEVWRGQDSSWTGASRQWAGKHRWSPEWYLKNNFGGALTENEGKSYTPFTLDPEKSFKVNITEVSKYLRQTASQLPVWRLLVFTSRHTALARQCYSCGQSCSSLRCLLDSGLQEVAHTLFSYQDWQGKSHILKVFQYFMIPLFSL